MNAHIAQQIEDLHKLNLRSAAARYRELFGAAPLFMDHRQVIARVGWKLQADALGGLSERARERAAQIAAAFELRVRSLRGHAAGGQTTKQVSRDVRLPAPGTLLTRYYRSKPVVVQVLEEGFEHEGRRYKSLTAIARQATGTRWNGYAFFGLKGGARHA